MNKEQIKAMMLLKTARGQIEGVIKMMEDERYCVDISNQIIAIQALLKKTNIIILKQHIDHCVREAVSQDKGSAKIEEIMDIVAKIIQK